MILHSGTPSTSSPAPTSHSLLRFDRTSLTSQTCWTALFSLSTPPFHRSPCMIRSDDPCMIQYDLAPWLVFLLYDTILGLSGVVPMYDINLRATTTMILSTRGVTIPIDLVSSAMDSIRQRVALFKPVTVPTSDPKSEFLCQSSLYCTEPADSLNHLVHLGYLPHPCHHVSLVLSSSKCSHRVP